MMTEADAPSEMMCCNEKLDEKIKIKYVCHRLLYIANLRQECHNSKYGIFLVIGV